MSDNKSTPQIKENKDKTTNRSNGSQRSYERNDDFDVDDPKHGANKLWEEQDQIVSKEVEEYLTVKRKTSLCYYVMKLAEYGELYSFIEHTDRFEERSVRYILD
jgi:serine/threonine protein kinase